MLDFLTKVKNNITAVLGVIVAILFGWLWIEKSRNDAANAEVKNQKDQDKINALSQDQAKLDGENQAEAQKRADLDKQMETNDNAKLDQDAILRTLNDPNLGK